MWSKRYIAICAALLIAVSCVTLANAVGFDLYQTGEFNVALITNLTGDAVTGIEVVFSQEVALVNAVVIGGTLPSIEEAVGTSGLVFSLEGGELGPYATIGLQWSEVDAMPLAIQWTREGGALGDPLGFWFDCPQCVEAALPECFTLEDVCEEVTHQVDASLDVFTSAPLEDFSDLIASVLDETLLDTDTVAELIVLEDWLEGAALEFAVVKWEKEGCQSVRPWISKADSNHMQTGSQTISIPFDITAKWNSNDKMPRVFNIAATAGGWVTKIRNQQANEATEVTIKKSGDVLTVYVEVTIPPCNHGWKSVELSVSRGKDTATAKCRLHVKPPK